jgi:hypothetical protein
MHRLAKFREHIAISTTSILIPLSPLVLRNGAVFLMDGLLEI